MTSQANTSAASARHERETHELEAQAVTGLRVQTVLCPINFSDASGEALRAAALLAQRFNARLVVMHVVPPLGPVLGIVSVETFRQSVLDETLAALLPFVQKALSDTEGKLSKDGRLFYRVQMGAPTEEIACLARQENADIIVMSSGGQANWQRLALGSVTDGVLQASPCPILVFRPVSGAVLTPKLPPRRVLCPLDWSGASLRAFDAALDLCEEFNAELCLLDVVPSSQGLPSEVESDASGRTYHQKAKQRFARLKRLRPEARHTRFLLHSDSNSAREIARTARGEHADLLVIAMDGQSSWRRFFAISTTTRVLREASCPVLVLPPKRGERARLEDMCKDATPDYNPPQESIPSLV